MNQKFISIFKLRISQKLIFSSKINTKTCFLFDFAIFYTLLFRRQAIRMPILWTCISPTLPANGARSNAYARQQYGGFSGLPSGFSQLTPAAWKWSSASTTAAWKRFEWSIGSGITFGSGA
jgi:hypothetical protein